MHRSKVLSPHQLHRRRVHAAEHLEQNCDICRIQGSFGQHGTQRLAGSRIGCCCAECECYLTGIMTSEIQTTTSELLSPVKSKQHNQCTSFYWHFSVACQSPIIKKIDASAFNDPGSACCKYWVTVFDGENQVTNLLDMNGFLVLFNKVIHITQPSCSCDLGQLIVSTWSILSQKHQKTEHVRVKFCWQRDKRYLSCADFCTSWPILRTAEPPCSSWARMDIIAWANR